MHRNRHRTKTVLSHSSPKAAMFPTRLRVLASLIVLISGHVCAQEKAPIEKVVAPKVDKKATTPPLKDNNVATTVLQAELIYGQPERDIHLQDEVEIQRGLVNVRADKASYFQTEDLLKASGNLRLQRGGDCYQGNELELILEMGVGFLTKPRYFLSRNHGQGQAERVDFESEEKAVVRNGTYSTCEGLSPDWYLRSDTLSLNTGTDRGIAGKSTLYFKGVPILGTPSWLNFSFPLSGARHSGLLPPTVGQSNKGGVELGLPYYFNLAPNRDMTLHPKWIANRGLQLGLEGRYLGESYVGETSLEGMKDRLTNQSRYAIASQHRQQILPELGLSWNINKASDNDYAADFSNSSNKTAQRLLLREVGLDYYGHFWHSALRATRYQVLQDLTAPISLPYERLPQWTLRAAQNDIGGFDWSVDASVTQFSHPTMVSGKRAIINPQLAFPYIRAAYFIIPKLSFHVSRYQIEANAKAPAKDLQRSVPSVSVDSGLIFERPAALFGEAMTQTLEPRLFYVNTPYRDQSDFPLFDTALADFNFAQIFSENRFTGQDRIGDSNQVTAALISRFIENNGTERVKLALGQRFYFNTQRVSLDHKTNPSRSDLLLAASGQLSATVRTEAALQVSQSDRHSVRSNYAIYWNPAPKKILNLQYQFQRDVLKQLEISGQWPMAQRWYVVGKSNYSLQENKLVEGLAGLEYRADCWALRFVAHRFATTHLSNNSGFSLQLELTGLARLGLGANPIETLRKSISGYSVN